MAEVVKLFEKKEKAATVQFRKRKTLKEPLISNVQREIRRVVQDAAGRYVHGLLELKKADETLSEQINRKISDFQQILEKLEDIKSKLEMQGENAELEHEALSKLVDYLDNAGR